MTCFKCQSHMLPSFPIRFHAQSTDASEPVHHLCSYRCLACGNYEDSRIRQNRKAAQVAS